MSDAAESEIVEEERRMGWPAIAVAIVFGLLYAYDLFLALSNLIGLSSGLSDPGIIPWSPLIVGVIVPPAAYAASFLVGRRRSLGLFALTLLTGLAVAFAVALSLEAYVAVLLVG